jgi:hypothetical protein
MKLDFMSLINDYVNNTAKYENWGSDEFINTGGSFTLNLSKGYNLFTKEFVNSNVSTFVEKGFTLKINATDGLVAFESVDFEDSDLEFSGPKCINTRRRAYVRAIMSPLKKLGLSKRYAAPGNYTITVNVSDKSVSKQILVVEEIVNLSMLVNKSSDSSYCMLNEPCILDAVLSNGSHVTYQWRIDKLFNSTSFDSSLTYTFRQEGFVSVYLNVSNPLSATSIVQVVYVYGMLSDLAFHSGNRSESASIVGQKAEFKFELTGCGYVCDIDFGDSTKLEHLAESNFSFMNFLVSKSYPSEEAVYTMTINCSNPFSQVNLTFNHYVQYMISNLRLMNRGALYDNSYTIDFVMDYSGSSSITIRLFVDNQLDDGTRLVNSSMIQSSLYRAENIHRIRLINIMVSNIVSSVTLNETFEICPPLGDIYTQIIPPGPDYLFSEAIIFHVSIPPSPTIVELIISTGEIVIRENLNVSSLLVKNYTHNYKNPGDYKIVFIVQNRANMNRNFRTISVKSGVDKLQVQLSQTPVTILSNGFGAASFFFSYLNDSKHGSHAQVSMWPGDETNSTNGPFRLNMNYDLNKSRFFPYNYKTNGTYEALFLVENSVGKAIYGVFVNVIMQEITSFSIDVKPQVATPDAQVVVQAFLTQTSDVLVSFSLDNVFQSSKNRSGKAL